MKPEPTRLARRLNTFDAVVLGLGSMIGAGIFAAAGPASVAAGHGLWLAVLMAGFLAYLNATSMAQLAALYPESGGTYVYGRKRLSPTWGFLAGWGFVIGKLSSCAAMALTFSYYLAPEHPKEFACAAVLLLTFVNYLGVKKTARLTQVLVALVLMVLGFLIFTSFAGGGADFDRLQIWDQDKGLMGLLQASGLMFFAFAGYARIATLGEEVIDPKITIPKSILTALALTLIIYLAVIVTLLLTVEMTLLQSSKAPLTLALQSGVFSRFDFIVRIGACLGSLSVLLSLMAGISRTVFAMSLQKDLPVGLSAVHPKYKSPYFAEIIVGLIVVGIVSVSDLMTAIGFSSFAILMYYAIANLSAWTLDAKSRLYPRFLSLLGFLSCLILALSLPQASILYGLVLFALGLLFFKIKNYFLKSN